MRTFERYCKKCPALFVASAPGNTLCPECRPAKKATATPIRPCAHCGVEFTRRTNGNKYCETCVPVDNAPARMRMSNFRMSEPEYQALRAALPDGLCPICTTWQGTAVDHDHQCCGLRTTHGRTCGKCVRGLLCLGCNLMIEKYESGKLAVAPPSALAYLNRQGL